MKDIQDISAFWKAHNNSDLVLATIVRKTGSAYRQPGAKKVISTYGADAGYLSGGCLEGEINRTACEGFSKLPFVKSFSTMSDEDRLMGYQTGCAGEIAILFERLPDYNQENVKTYLAYGLDDCAGVRVELDDQKLGQRHFVESEQDCEDDACFFDAAVRPVALNVIGAGPNSRPFSELCKTLGWQVRFLDYRPSEIDGAIQSPISEFHTHVMTGPHAALIIMTHNYEADMDVLENLHEMPFGYMAAVGPKSRFENLKSDIKRLKNLNINLDWFAKFYAPAGLFKGRAPEEIALSIVAEIQSVEHGRKS